MQFFMKRPVKLPVWVERAMSFSNTPPVSGRVPCNQPGAARANDAINTPMGARLPAAWVNWFGSSCPPVW